MSGIWHLITGEYPPLEGGIGDYSGRVAEGLAGLGLEVHVWTTGQVGASRQPDGPTLHRIGPGWSRGDLANLGRGLDAFPSPRHLLIQYAPNAFGFKGMNLGFARWLVGRKGRGDRVDAMFHEVCYLPGPYDTRAVRRLLPLVQRPMARRILLASDRVFVSTPRWLDLLAPLDPRRGRALRWLPVPSTIPVVDDPSGVLAIRRRVSPEGGAIVGSFGTFSNAVGGLLAEVLPGLLEADPRRVGLLIGRNGEGFAGRMVVDHPSLVGRLHATGGLGSGDVSKHLQACDLLIQPYPDGVCGRRTSFMAGLSHGVATVSTAGRSTPPGWEGSEGLAFARDGDRAGLVGLASRLLDDPEGRAALGRAGRGRYERSFGLGVTLEALLDGS